MIDQQPIYIHSANGMHILSSSISPYMNDLSCNSITIQAENVGSAYIVSTPSGATIYIDDEKQSNATTPATINISNDSSTPQVHKYKLVLPGYADANGSLLITPGQIYNTTVLLEILSKNTLPLILGLAITGSFIMMMLECQRKKDMKRSELMYKDKLKLKRLEQERSELMYKDKLKLKRLEQERSELMYKDKLKLKRLEQERSELMYKDKLKLKRLEQERSDQN